MRRIHWDRDPWVVRGPRVVDAHPALAVEANRHTHRSSVSGISAVSAVSAARLQMEMTHRLSSIARTVP